MLCVHQGPIAVLGASTGVREEHLEPNQLILVAVAFSIPQVGFGCPHSLCPEYCCLGQSRQILNFLHLLVPSAPSPES